ncbi:MAG TPA: tetratricopeptide repeat protein [Pyrinomonadaceae bacterium]
MRRYSVSDTDLLAAGRELGADSILIGSIQKWGDKIRVNVSLVKVVDGTTIWNGSFDERMTDIFAVQDSITGKVLSSLSLKNSGRWQAGEREPRTENAKAYESYLRGRLHYFRITPGDVDLSIGYFRQAIEADPNYALAYAALADAYRTQAIAAHEPAKNVCPEAKRLALRALEIDPELAEGYIVLGWVELFYEWDWKAAENYLNRAIELAPYDSDAYRARGHLYSILGRHDEAISDGRRATELAPLTAITRVLEAQYLYYAGQLEEALSVLREVEKTDSSFWATYATQGRIFTLRQEFDAAIEAFKKAEPLSGGSFEIPAQLGYVLGRAGRNTDARELIAEMEKSPAERIAPRYFLALVYNGLGQKESAIEMLRRAFSEREAQMVFLKVDQRWDWLRQDPSFIEIERQMNLGG